MVPATGAWDPPRAPAFTAAPPQTPHRSGDGTGHGWRRRRNGAQEDGWGRGRCGRTSGDLKIYIYIYIYILSASAHMTWISRCVSSGFAITGGTYLPPSGSYPCLGDADTCINYRAMGRHRLTGVRAFLGCRTLWVRKCGPSAAA
jgi:hypothetical protein